MKTRIFIGVVLAVTFAALAGFWGEARYRAGYSAAEQAAEAKRREVEMFEYYAAALPGALSNMERLRTELTAAQTDAERRRICDLLAGAIYNYGFLRRDYLRALGGREDLFSYEGALALGMQNKLPRLEEVPSYWHPDDSQWYWDQQRAIRSIIVRWTRNVPDNWRPNLRETM